MCLAVSAEDAVSVSGEITVPMATQQIAWRLLWLWAPWQRILYAAGSISLALSLSLSEGSLGLCIRSHVRNQNRRPLELTVSFWL